MNTIRKNTVFGVLILFIVSIIPFPLLADNIKVYKDIFTDETRTEIYIPVEAEMPAPANEIYEPAVEMQDLASLQHEIHVSDSLEIYSQTITPDTKGILEYNGIKMEIPAGAVEKEITIEIIKLESAPGINETIKNVTTGAVSYRFLPVGIKFNKNIKISIPFNKALLESETALSNLYTYFYDEDGCSWEPLPRVKIDRENCVVISLTNHFTDMINATLKMPESPEPVNFDINSIKNLEAVNPSSGVMSLKGLTPDSMGSASFQIPLNLPSGRGSAYPILALSYNSDSQNSWMGRGFDISVPSITTDTKFGLPEYNDTDTFILAGEELVLTSGSGSFPKFYSSRVEKSFSRITRYFDGGVDYWEVTDKNGRVQTFGTEEGWVGPDRNNHAKTYTWYLTRETDAKGNFVSYIYDYDSVNKYIYLKEIRYSGNSNISSSYPGPYKVVFNTTTSRPDRRMDARGRFVSKLIRRLDGVDISYNGEVFRSYSFLYDQNEFGQTVLKEFSESDGNGNEFYVYGFIYEKLPEVTDGNGSVLGYNGFGSSVNMWSSVSDSVFPGLNQTRSYGVGASLYAGLKFELRKFKNWKFRWSTVFDIGVSGGVNFSNTITKSTLLDIDGDGLSDAVWKDWNHLKAYRNTGSGFDTDNEILVSTMSASLNESNQLGYSLGASAGLFGATAAVTLQRNWTNGKSSFSDINGDGYIDFVKSDSSTFLMNTGGGFTTASYGSEGASVTQNEDIDEEEYKRVYSSQEPLRKWKSFTGGTVEIKQRAEMVNSTNISSDGVKAVTYPDDGNGIYSINLLSGNSVGEDSRELTVSNGSEIYFLMDEGLDNGSGAGKEYRGDDLDWDIDIKYLNINYFEGLCTSGIITPEGAGETDNSIITNSYFIPVRISKDIFSSLLENASETEVELDGDGNILNIVPGGRARMLDGYIYRPEFKDFIRINNDADSTVQDLIGTVLTYGEREMLYYYTDFTGEKVHPKREGETLSFIKHAPEKRFTPVLYTSFEDSTPGNQLFSNDIFLDRITDPEGIVMDEYLYLIPSGDSYNLVSEINGTQSAVNNAEIIKIEDTITVEFERADSTHYYVLSDPTSILQSLPAVQYDNALLEAVTGSYIFAYPDYSVFSCNDYGSFQNAVSMNDKVFLQEIFQRYPAIPDIESFNLRENLTDSDKNRLMDIFIDQGYRTLTPDEYGGLYDSAAEGKLLLESVYIPTPSLENIEYYSLKTGLLLAEKTDLVNIILGHSHTEFNFDEYTGIYNPMDTDDKIFFDSVYNRYPVIPDIEYYELISDLSDEQKARFVLLMDNLSNNSDSIIDNPFLTGSSIGIIALSSDEYNNYFTGTPEIENLFYEITDTDNNIFYALNDNISPDEKDLLEFEIKKYIRDYIEFPYYNYNEILENYILKEDLAESDKVNIGSLFNSLGWRVYTVLNRHLHYSSDSVLPVSYTDNPTVDVVDNPFPSGKNSLTHSSPGVVSISSFNSSGDTVLFKKYIHSYSARVDFDPENLIEYPEDIYNDEDILGSKLEGETDGTHVPGGFEMFTGGVGGWYYGFWSGYYEFDKELIHRNPPQNGEDEVSLPKYFQAMVQNKDEDGNPKVTVVGKDSGTLFSLDTDSMIGGVSSYTESSFDAGGNPSNTTYFFAPVIKGSFVHADRKDGDTYYNVPRGSSPVSGGQIGNVSAGKSESKDVNGGVSLPFSDDTGIGFSFSKNSGVSWQTQGLMDINGDRYPDMISYTSDKGGASSFTAVHGTGAGFGNSATYTTAAPGRLSYSNNVSYGFGAAPGGGLGSIVQNYDPNGKVKDTTISAPDMHSQVGVGFSGLNGTAGSSVRTEGLIDLTGDGLPDRVSRTGSGDYLVSVNRGDRGFADAVSFSDGINTTLYSMAENTGDLGNSALGLSFSNTGTLGTGGSLSVSFPAGVVKSASLSMGFNASSKRTLSQLMDINGDGLSDQVVKKPLENFFRVRFNLGDTFSLEEVHIYKPDWETTFADTAGLLGFLMDSNSSALNNLDIPYLDLNSISRPSFLTTGGDSPFLSIINPLTVDDTISYSGGISLSLGASVSMLFGVNLGIARFGFTLIPGINGFYAVSTTSLSMQDINGDGLPDHILKKTGLDPVKTLINSMGKTGLLNKIIIPAGGSIDLKYGREGNTVAMPQNRYVLRELVKNDGFEDDPSMAGEHRYTETFGYNGGYYDRDERKFYGFHEVTVTKGDGSVTTTRYNNSDYYTKGLVLFTETRDGNGRVFQEQENSYSLRTVGSYTGGVAKFPYLSTEISRIYDPSDSDTVETEKHYLYDNYGNVISLEDMGVASDPDDNIILNIAYSDNYDFSYLKSLPVSLTVRDSIGEIIRKREGSYDGRGNLVSLRSYYSENNYSEYTFGYGSEYGNLISVTNPLGYRKEYTYDSAFHRYVTGIETSSIHGGDSYTSNLSYDYRFGVETSQTDSNGNIISKEYDNFGRLNTIISSYDTGTVKAVEYSYLTDSFPWKAMTKNKISFDPGSTDTMDTWVITDGLNRIILTAKEGEVYNEAGNLNGWKKSGYVVYDSKARPVGKGQTVFEETSTAPSIENTALRPTIKTYDALDRILAITFPDNSVITKDYGVEGLMTTERVTDPLGNITETKKDIRGNIVGIEKRDSSGMLLTESSYIYNVLGELLKVTDAKGSDVTFSYDILGRRLTLQSPETGLAEFEYDKADHLIRKVDANLRNNGASINYIYDTLGRIEKIDYPFMEDTVYTYGVQGDDYNRAGRIVKITDESGSIENFYGKLGETTQVIKTIKRLAPLEDDKSASFNYTFDYQGRMETITYPDGEVVSYTYNRSGEVEKINSVHNGLNTTYIENIGYDEFGQRTYIRYENGIETKYTYDEDRRWLNNIETKNAFNTLQEIDYTFDRTGNILSIINVSGRYLVNQNYEYDGLYQLTKGAGYFEDKEFGFVQGTSKYTQNFTYDNTGNILSKTSSNIVNPSGGVNSLNYNLEYSYYADKPKQAEIVGNFWYLYDSNGNIMEERTGGHSAEGIQGSGTITKHGEITEMNRGIALTRNTSSQETVYKRTYIWDEENRLKTTIDPAHTVEYRYDYSGERTNKMSDNGSETLYFNSMWLTTKESYDFRQSKNIYLGETRIATRLNMESDPSTGYEAVNTYYYHGDHLGSSNIVTTPDGEVFEHIEYTPYGEIWIEKSVDLFDMLPYKFTAKELDEETGLYYYGARYLNPRTSRWISTDLTGSNLISPNRNGYSFIEANNWYSYTSNNPVRFSDPTGFIIKDVTRGVVQQDSSNNLGNGGASRDESIAAFGCVLTTFTRIANALSGDNFSIDQANAKAIELGLYTNGNELSPAAGAALVNALIDDPSKTLAYDVSINGNGAKLGLKLNELENSNSEFFTTGRIHTENAAGSKKYDHQVNINSGSVTAGDVSDINNPFNFNLEDTSNTNRQSTGDTARSNELFRVDVFKVIDTHQMTQ